MATLPRLVNTRELKTNLWAKKIEEHEHPQYRYDRRVDALMLLIVDPNTTSKVVHYIDEHVALLYEPESKEVIGIRIEAFERSFLPHYSSLQDAWRLSDKGIKLENFGDFAIHAQIIETKYQPKVTRELTSITRTILTKQSFELPVYA